VVASYRLGLVDGCLFAGGEIDVEPDHLAPEGDGLVIGYVLEGVVRVSQLGQVANLGPGGFTCYDGCTPFRVSAPGQHRFLVLRVPLTHPRSVHADAGLVLARDLSTLSSAAPLAALVRAVVEHGEQLPPAVAAHVGDAVTACANAVIVEASGSPGPSGHSALFASLTRWLEDRLADPRLSARTLAAAHFLSERTVRGVFAEHGTTVSTYVRERRLERIRLDLLDPRRSQTAVSALAARWGIANASVFSRVFRRRYGVSPHQFRARHHPTR
jgi:AraC-like DNA-binding protein